MVFSYFPIELKKRLQVWSQWLPITRGKLCCFLSSWYNFSLISSSVCISLFSFSSLLTLRCLGFPSVVSIFAEFLLFVVVSKIFDPEHSCQEDRHIDYTAERKRRPHFYISLTAKYFIIFYPLFLFWWNRECTASSSGVHWVREYGRLIHSPKEITQTRTHASSSSLHVCYAVMMMWQKEERLHSHTLFDSPSNLVTFLSFFLFSRTVQYRTELCKRQKRTYTA